MRSVFTALSIVFTGISPIYAAGLNDPDWPCIQRRVDTLSAAVMWPHPPENQAETGTLSPEAARLAELLALRRLSLEEAESAVDATADLTKEDYTAIFSDVFDRLNQRRVEVMGGITRYARNQARMAQEIDALRSEIATLSKTETPDFDRIDQLEEDLDWRARVFDDRRRSLTYACEAPVLLEKRLYSLAQILAARVAE
ncbi:hypothetical protein [Roseovarius sp. BRH_c41]|jgi:hypothetical protein|uniref:hypothetical protein n=1 Tax=Roseovarius sp. BRH_c41 TaxID=1629709 RepID=UPI0005F2247C|nr:hypothetical protein [Roseovarius sp. BRH_c41]KJS42900.1 MAG: hypothetical protein VR71_12825 [Roseovarius sp. BRH_c41]KJS45607.1 MAG: hypothetical protein VR71_01520 [Roseovarius sp. BRH_c41]